MRAIMRQFLKCLVVSLPLLAVVVLIACVLAVNAALKAHGREDAIIFGSQRLEQAINDYVAKHGKPPAMLEALIPDFVGSLPQIPGVSKGDYSVSADGQRWTLDMLRTNSAVPLIYRRTNTRLSSEDARRLIDKEGGCYLLRVR
jgi:hypothetical protein